MRSLIIYFSITVTSLVASNVRFEGYVASAQGSRFALFDADTGDSKWIKIGGVFEGLTLVGFDQDTKVLIARRGEEKVRLPLQGIVSTTPSKVEASEAWRQKAEIAVLHGNAEVKELLKDYDHASAEEFGYGVAVDFGRKHPADGVGADENRRLQFVVERELKLKHEVAAYIKDQIITQTNP